MAAGAGLSLALNRCRDSPTYSLCRQAVLPYNTKQSGGAQSSAQRGEGGGEETEGVRAPEAPSSSLSSSSTQMHHSLSSCSGLAASAAAASAASAAAAAAAARNSGDAMCALCAACCRRHTALVHSVFGFISMVGKKSFSALYPRYRLTLRARRTGGGSGVRVTRA